MKKVGISAPLKSSALRRMLDALGEVLDVRVEERTFGNDHGLDAWILFEADQVTIPRLTNSACPCYTVIRSDRLVPCQESATIEFARHYTLPPVLRGRQVKADEAAELKSLPQYLENMTVLASKAGNPVWAVQEFRGFHHHYVSLQIPELNDGESLFQYFHRGKFLQLLPLLLFLHSLAEDRNWEQPPLQACFMFDDPNLHWRSYGFIDFAEIAAHAKMHNYHACFATIPLDAWFVHKPTALLFQQYRDQLSLLIHGNDHIAEELAKPYLDEELSRSLQQVLRRIDEFERRSGVPVSRVMAPPHGACSESTLGKMARLGFEAACISKGSLSYYNGKATWLRTLGMKPYDIIGGLPVFPRFPFSVNCHNSILISALLHQPIIAMGHHHDVAEGLQHLADLSKFVNSLGTVHWADMQGISRAHYARRQEGTILRVKMFTKRIEVIVPEGTSQILVERPWLNGLESLHLAWRHLNDSSEWKLHHADEPVPVLPCQKIEILAEKPPLPDTNARNLKSDHLWPVVRRQITEARDRLAPALRRVSAFLIKSDDN